MCQLVWAKQGKPTDKLMETAMRMDGHMGISVKKQQLSNHYITESIKAI